MTEEPNSPDQRNDEAGPRERNGQGPEARSPATRPLGAPGSGWVSTRVAAAALNKSPRTVRDYITRGELDGLAEGEGVQRKWYVSIDSVQAQRNRLKDAGDRVGDELEELARALPPAGRRGRDAQEVPELDAPANGQSHPDHRGGEAADDAADAAAGTGAARAPAPSHDATELMREMLLRIEHRTAEAADLRARLQLTELAESTLRETLGRERQRADRLEEENARLRSRADELNSRSWWRRLFRS